MMSLEYNDEKCGCGNNMLLSQSIVNCIECSKPMCLKCAISEFDMCEFCHQKQLQLTIDREKQSQFYITSKLNEMENISRTQIYCSRCRSGFDPNLIISCRICSEKYCETCSYDKVVAANMLTSYLVCEKHTKFCFSCHRNNIITMMTKCDYCNDLACLTVNCGSFNCSVLTKYSKNSFKINACYGHTSYCENEGCFQKYPNVNSTVQKDCDLAGSGGNIMTLSNSIVTNKCLCAMCYESYRTGIESLMLKFKRYNKCNLKDIINYILQFILI